MFDPVCAWVFARVPFSKSLVAFLRSIWHSICDRAAEWMLTAWTLNFGVTLAQGGTFAGPSYAVMKEWATIETWMLFCLIGGTGRLFLLIANGGWKKSPHFRVMASLGTIPLWYAIGRGFELAGTGSTGTGAYYICIAFEIINAYRALLEAGWNDGKAPHQGNRG